MVGGVGEFYTIGQKFGTNLCLLKDHLKIEDCVLFKIQKKNLIYYLTLSWGGGAVLLEEFYHIFSSNNNDNNNTV